MHTNKKIKRKWKQVIAMITASALISTSGTFGEVSFAMTEKAAVKTVEDSGQTAQTASATDVAEQERNTEKNEITFKEIFEKFTSGLSQKGIMKTMASSSDLVYGDYTYTISENEATITGYKGSGSSIVIPSVIEGYKVTNIGDSVFSGCDNLISIKIPNSVTSIGNHVFYRCRNLNNIEIPNSVTSIGDVVFGNCKSLTSIKLPIGVMRIGRGTFLSCTNLASVEMSSNVTSIEEAAFWGCISLSDLELSSNVTNIGSIAFVGCRSLTSLEIPSSVTCIEETAFIRCGSLEKIKVDRQNKMYDSRDNCNAIIEKKTNTLMRGCKNTIIPNDVTKIGLSSFSGCNSLTSITIPDNVTSIGKSAFQNCSNLKDVYYTGNEKAWNQIDIEEDNDTLTSATIHYNSKDIYMNINKTTITLSQNIYTYDGSEKTPDVSVVLDGRTLIKDIDYTLSYSNNINVGIATVTITGKGDYTDVVSKTFNIKEVANSGSCGDGLTWKITGKEKSLTLSIDGTGKMTDYDSYESVPWYNRETAVTSIVIGDKVESIGNYAFYGFSKLSSITIPPSVKSIGDYAFMDLEDVKGIVIPDGVQTIGKHAFYSCDSLRYIEISDSVSEIGNSAFDKCNKLTDIVFCGNAPKLGSNCLTNSDDVKIFYPNAALGWNSIIQNSEYDLCTWNTWDSKVKTRDIVLLLDVSGSMEDRIDKLKMAAILFIKEMGGRLKNTRVSVVTYNASATVLSDLTTNNETLGDLISKLNADGDTAYLEALKSAKKLLEKSTANEKSIVMFSDGEPNDSQADIYALAEELRTSYTIYTVGLVDSDSRRNVLKKVAGGDGNYFESDNIDGLVNAFLKLAEEIDTVVEKFKIDEKATGIKDGNVMIGGELIISNASDASADILSKKVSNIKWTSSDQSIVSDEGISCKGVNAYDNHSAMLMISLTPQKAGTVIITGILPNGLSKSCEVTITEEIHVPTEKVHVPTEKVVTLTYRSDGTIGIPCEGSKSVKASHDFYYSDNFFYSDTTSYNNSLAVMSLGLELTSFSSPKYDTKDANENNIDYMSTTIDNERAENLKEAYNALEFRNAKYYNYNTPLFDDSDKVAFSFARKNISDGQSEDTLIAVVIRGGGYGAEWVSNFHVGNSGNAIGFDSAAKEVLQKLKEYLQSIKINGNLKLWITGYSRGGAVANILTHYINEERREVYSSLKKNNIFAYTFATPNGYRKNDSNNVDDGNLWNIVSANDIVPKLALVQWGFSKYGNTRVLPEYSSGALKENYKCFTGKDFNLNYANKAELAITDVLYDATLGTFIWTLQFEGDVKNILREANAKTMMDRNVLIKEVLHMLDDKIRTKTGKMQLLYVLSCVVGEKLAYEITSSDQDESSIQYVMTNMFDAHYPEYYLCWLEGGDSMLLKENLYARVSKNSQDGRRLINDTVEKLFEEIYKQYKFFCPVDVNIYKSDGTLAASIVNNKVIVEELPCYVNGDEKVVYLTGDDTYSLELIGNDTGTMDYIVNEYNSSSEVIRSVYYYDVPLDEGLTYTDTIDNEILDEQEDYSITDGEVVTIPALDTLVGDMTEYEITIENGVALKSTATVGEFVSIISLVDDGYEFVKWTSDEGIDIFDDVTAQNTSFRMPGHNIVIKAVWKNSASNNNTITISPTATPTITPSAEVSSMPSLTSTPETEKKTTPPTTEKPSVPHTTATPPAKNPDIPTIKKQTKVKIGNNMYTITNPSKKTVSFSGLVKKTKKKVTIPATITYNGQKYKVTSIGEKAFSGNKKVTTVTIGKNVTDIGAKAFYKCTKLAKITIPSKVNKIRKQAFRGCSKLKNITIKTTKLTAKNVGSKAFKGIPKRAVIKVPRSKKKVYQKMLKKKGISNKTIVK